MVKLRTVWFMCATALLCVHGTDVFTQAPAVPAFEVASVKANNLGGGALVYPEAGGLIRMINVSLSSLLQNAYDVQDDQVVGPDWIRTSNFDVLAKTPNNRPAVLDGPDSIRPMLRTLLQERFKLAVHHETRTLRKYALVVARADGRLGPRLQRSTTDCAPLNAQRAAQPGGPAFAPPASGTPCTLLRSGASFVADSVNLSGLGRLLGPFPGLASSIAASSIAPG